MLRKILSFSLVTIVMISSVKARIIRVNGDGYGDYLTAQAAYNKSKQGDTLQFEPVSVNTYSYGDISSIAHKVVLIGTGANFGTPNLQFSANNPYLGKVPIDAGGDGTVIMVNNQGVTINNANNVLIQRCNVTNNGISATNINGLIIKGCFIDQQVITLNNANNCIISNNILYGASICGGTGQSGNITMDANSSGTINNNTFQSVSNVFYNSTITNNIFVSGTQPCCGCGVSNPSFNSCSVVTNNVFSFDGFSGDSQPTSANSNKFNQPIGNIIINTGNNDQKYQLLSGGASVASGAGIGGIDCGAFDGTPFSYKLSVQPPIPAIYKLTVPTQAGQFLQVTISTKSNN